MGLGLGQPLGLAQSPGPVGDKGFALGSQRKLAAQDTVEDQAEGHRQGQRATRGDGGGPIRRRQEEGDQRRCRGGRACHQQAVQARCGEEHAGHGRSDVNGQDDVPHRARVGPEDGDLGHGQRPEQASADVEGRPAVHRHSGLILVREHVDHGVEGRPVQPELDEDRRHPGGVGRIGSSPDEHGQSDPEERQRIGQQFDLGLQRARLDGALAFRGAGLQLERQAQNLHRRPH